MTDFQQNKIQERIIELRKKHLKLNQKAFGQPISYTQSSISEMEKGNNRITEKFILSLCNYYKVRKEWIENGEEPIFQETNNDSFITFSNDIYKNKHIDIGGTYLMLTPLVDEFSYAEYLENFRDSKYLSNLPTHPIYVNKFYKGYYQSFIAVGNAMISTSPDNIEYNIYDGNIVTGREIIQAHWQLQLNTHKFKDYIIVYKDGILIRRIIDHNLESQSILLQALNENKELYPDIEVNLNDVYQIFSIIEVSQKRKI